jgi:hypothetical protein
VLQVHGQKEARPAVECLGLAEEKEAAGAEREVEVREDRVLRLHAEVHERVARDEQVDLRDRGVAQEVVAAEDDRAADVAAHRQPAVAVFEVLGAEILRDRFGRFCVVARVPSFAKRVVVEVSGIDLDPLRVGLGAECLGEEHGDRVRLFSRRAAGRPRADPLAAGLLFDDLRDDLLGEVLPGIRVTEEPCDVDQNRVQELGELPRFGLEVAAVVLVGVHARGLHALLETAHEARPLVL